MEIGWKAGIAETIASMLILHGFWAPDFVSFAVIVFAPFVAFIVVSAILMKVFAKASAKEAAVNAFASIATLLFSLTAMIAIVGLIPASIIMSSWILPFLLSIIIAFTSFFASSYVYVSRMKKSFANTNVLLLAVFFAISLIAAAFAVSQLIPWSNSSIFDFVANING